MGVVMGLVLLSKTQYAYRAAATCILYFKYHQIKMYTCTDAVKHTWYDCSKQVCTYTCKGVIVKANHVPWRNAFP